MKNLKKPSEKYQFEEGSTFETNSNGIQLYNENGEPMRLHVAANGFLYINGEPFGVAGMPPANHASSHFTGAVDEISPDDIGALALSSVVDVPTANGVPKLDENGLIPSAFMAGNVKPQAHAESHAKGGIDEITPLSIGAVADNDSRLTDSRTPKFHKASHGKEGVDRILPSDIGAVDETDSRMTNDRFPTSHNYTHFKNGADPISWADVGSVDADLFTQQDRIPNGYPQLNDIGHIDINLLPRGLAPAGHKETHEMGGIDELALDSSQIVSGIIDIARLPNTAINRQVDVQTITEMLRLTTAQVQNGDVVYVVETKTMYRVKDDTQLSDMAGYQEFSAGISAQVPWSGVQDKPSTFTPSLHASSHALGGLDEITAAMIGTLTAQEISSLDTSLENRIQANIDLVADDLASFEASTNTAIESVSSDLSAYKTSNNSAVSALTVRVSDTEADITGLSNTINALAQKVSELEATLANGVITSSTLAALEVATAANKGSYLTYTTKG